ncbi:hypothetical protein QTP88_019709 [Uroleucon formosanum]
MIKIQCKEHQLWSADPLKAMKAFYDCQTRQVKISNKVFALFKKQMHKSLYADLEKTIERLKKCLGNSICDTQLNQGNTYRILTTIMSQTIGSSEANNVTPSEASKNKILNLIKGITLNDINGEEIEKNKENYITESDDEDGESEGITEFLRTIEEECLNNSKVIGTSLSGYWALNQAKDILRVSSVESDFGDLKRKILRYEVQPMTADGFVIKHLKARQ